MIPSELLTWPLGPPVIGKQTRPSLSPSHIRQHCLPEMPTEKRVNRPTRILTKSPIEMLPSDALRINVKADDLVIIPKQLSTVSAPKTT